MKNNKNLFHFYKTIFVFYVHAKKSKLGWARWFASRIVPLQNLRQKDHRESEVSLEYIMHIFKIKV